MSGDEYTSWENERAKATIINVLIDMIRARSFLMNKPDSLLHN